MATLELEKISAVIQVGSYVFCTPGRMSKSAGDITSFTVTRNRNSPTAQLNCAMAAWINPSWMSGNMAINNNLGDKIIVQAGVGDDVGNLPTLFTGYVTGMKTRPHWNDARKIMVDIVAEDEFVKLKLGAKFSRRFKMSDDAFAIITGGRRRQAGNLAIAKKMPAGRQGITNLDVGSSMGSEHSPLIKTPDPQGKSPKGSRPPTSSSQSETGADKVPLRMEPAQAWVSAGMRIFVQVMEVESGRIVDVEECEAIGKCCCHCNPAPKSFSGSRGNKKTGMTVGEKVFPVSVNIGTPADPNAKGYEFTITGDYPAQVTFVHPKTGQTCTIKFDIIPPHDHRDIARGGPAVGSYDVFQI
jgi:hypothetical protein